MTLKQLKKTSTTRASGDCFDKAKISQFWKLLWKLNCPNKMKHFLWRACRDILPTNYRLATRKVINDDSFAFCGECESSRHILWDCKVASKVWKEVDLGLPVLDQPTRDFVDVVWVLKDRKESTDWELFAITAWHIWNNRNNFKYEGRCKEVKRISKEVCEYGLEVHDASMLCPLGMAPVSNQWRPLRQGRYKVNVDGVVFASLGCDGRWGGPDHGSDEQKTVLPSRCHGG